MPRGQSWRFHLCKRCCLLVSYTYIDTTRCAHIDTACLHRLEALSGEYSMGNLCTVEVSEDSHSWNHRLWWREEHSLESCWSWWVLVEFGRYSMLMWRDNH